MNKQASTQGGTELSRSDFRDYTSKLYEIISTPWPNRDWQSERELYHPDARLVRTGLNEDGSSFAKVMSLDEFIENADELLANVEFSETEMRHEARIFGNVAQVASIYEKTYKTDMEKSHGRGINFFNLIYDGSKWLIMSVVWDNERDGLSISDLENLIV